MSALVALETTLGLGATRADTGVRPYWQAVDGCGSWFAIGIAAYARTQQSIDFGGAYSDSERLVT